jgi:hypothetical protein
VDPTAVIWIPGQASGWELPAAAQVDHGWLGGGRRTMHELAVAIAASGRRAELRGEVDVAYLDELAAAADAGVACHFTGNGCPAPYPPPAAKDVDVVALGNNRWAELAAPVVAALRERGVDCLTLPRADGHAVLDAFARARVVVHPSRIEAHSRIACEARAVGAVPAVLATNRFGVG